MTDELKPALSPEEWSASQIERGSFYAAADPGLTIGDDTIAGEIQGINVANEDLPALIALANAALPDASPYKITREKIDNLRSMIGADESWTQTSADSFALAESFLAALAAMLPPETP